MHKNHESFECSIIETKYKHLHTDTDTFNRTIIIKYTLAFLKNVPYPLDDCKGRKRERETKRKGLLVI